MKKKFCFLGFGQVAKFFLKKIIKENIDFKFITTSRDPAETKIFNGLEYKNFQLNDNNFNNKLVDEIDKIDHILISTPPINGIDLNLKYLGDVIKNSKKIKWITYLSATSVYGDHKGEWVTEESKTKPTSANGLDRLKAETAWCEIGMRFKLPLQVFRLAGIYSKDNNILKRLKIGNTQIIDKKNHFFSRIHVEDIANILFKSLINFKKNQIYNICDDKPASQSEVASYGAELLKLKKPNPIRLDEVESVMLKNFYKDSKKVDNKKMKTFFNYSLKFPTYVEGLNHIFDNNI